jgi:hypothetical protein
MGKRGADKQISKDEDDRDPRSDGEDDVRASVVFMGIHRADDNISLEPARLR